MAKKISKKLVALLLTAIMVMAMGVSAFAAEGDEKAGQYDATLYKAGTYGTDSQELSKGDAGILNADVSYDGTNTTITVYTVKMKYLGLIEGYVTAMSLVVDDVTYTGLASNVIYVEQSDGSYAATTSSYPRSFTFEIPGDYSGTGAHEFEGQFTVNTTLMSPNTSGDLVITIQ